MCVLGRGRLLLLEMQREWVGDGVRASMVVGRRGFDSVFFLWNIGGERDVVQRGVGRMLLEKYEGFVS